MKNILLKITAGVLLFLGISTSAQITTNGNTTSALADTNLFMDATKFEETANASYGKALGFPRTNLTTFTFNTEPMDNLVINSDFDGIVVYNNATGNTATGQGVVVSVVPGFYYFSNPGNPGNITSGRWIPMGGDPRVNIASAETPTNTSVNGNQVYAKRGTFQTSGSSTTPTSFSNAAIIPTAGSLYRITIYQSGTNNVYANSVYSYNNTNGSFVTGAPSMSVVYPAGTYNYTIEYTKTNN